MSSSYWPYSSGSGMEDALHDWNSELFGQEPPSSDPAFEYYEQGSRLGSEDAVSSGDDPPSVLWDFVLGDVDAVDNTVGDTLVNEEHFGDQYPVSKNEYLELFSEFHPHFNRFDMADSEASSSEAEVVEEDLAEIPFQPNHPSALRADVLWTSLAHAAQPPEYFCCVCCQKLYHKEAHPLRVPQGVDWNIIDWSCRHYQVEPTMIGGMPTACQKHKTLNDDCYEFVSIFYYYYYLTMGFHFFSIGAESLTRHLLVHSLKKNVDGVCEPILAESAENGKWRDLTGDSGSTGYTELERFAICLSAHGSYELRIQSRCKFAVRTY